MTVWAVGMYDERQEMRWGVMGIFETEDEAKAICKDWRYFIGPINVGEVYPEDVIDWKGAYYPTLGDGSE